MDLGSRSTFGKRKNTLGCGSSIFTLSEILATSLMHGPRIPARKTIIGIPLLVLSYRMDLLTPHTSDLYGALSVHLVFSPPPPPPIK